MKIRFETTDGMPHGLTTVGYWWFDQPWNGGTLHLESAKMRQKRFEIAVFGHELIEALYCRLRGITTEQCDIFDNECEWELIRGTRDKHKEPGFDKKCPYRWGHILGAAWEYAWIYGTFGSWKKYEQNCNQIMGI